jgi:MarR family transcriptional regulator, organic hydroperoxide resistance regulator
MAVTRSKRKKRKATPPSAPAVDAAAGKGTANAGLYENFLPYQIARLAYLLNIDLIEKLRREGINIARWRILAVLAMGDGITISEIIERAMMQQSALSRVLMTMEEEQYVRRVPRRDDGRYVDVFLTDKGRALFNSLDTVVRRRQNRLLKDFSSQDIDAAFALMRRLIHNLTD